MILTRIIGSISGAKLRPLIAAVADSGSPATPTVTTTQASTAVNQLTLAGTFTSNTTSRYFEHGATSGSLNSTLSMTNSEISKVLSSLSDGQTVYYRATGRNDNYTRTITGSINANFHETNLSIVHGTDSNLIGASTTQIGIYSGSSSAQFSINMSASAGVTYYYKIVAQSAVSTAETSITSYSAAPAIGYGSTLNQTTAATQPTPSITWENSEANRINNFRFYLTPASGNTYRWEYSSNLSTWTDGGAMTSIYGYMWTPFINPPTVDGATTYTYYRAKATDTFGRVKYSNIRGVAPINLKWGRTSGGVHTAGAYTSTSATNAVPFRMNSANDADTSMVTLQSFLGLSRYHETSSRWTLTSVTNGTYPADSSSRRFRGWARSVRMTEWTTYFNDTLNSQTYNRYTDYPDVTTNRALDSYWTTETLNYGGEDMPTTSTIYGPYYSDTNLLNRWSSYNSDVTVTVFYELQTLSTTTTNSTTLYYAG